jgi:hypothetical protein
MLAHGRSRRFVPLCLPFLVLAAAGSCGPSDRGGTERDSESAKAAAATLASEATGNNGDRTLTFISRCSGQTIRLGVNGGFVQECGEDGSCPTGTTCLTSRKPPGCFWNFPAPSSGSPVLEAGDQVVYQLDNPPIESTVVTNGETITQKIKWSGNVYASTHCASDGSGCLTAMCPSSEGGVSSVVPCPTGVGPQGPVTLAELTLVFDATDFYDISVINGVNVPVVMAPGTMAGDPSDPYFCQSPGSPSKSGTGLPGCSWVFDPEIVLDGQPTDQSTLLRAVEPGGPACGPDGSCTSGVCGRQLEIGTTDLAEICGAPLGWWTADEICVFTGNVFGSPVNCSQSVSGQGQVTDLYGCDGFNANSCYNKDQANSTCCGCPDWVIDGTTLPLAPGFQCYGTNSQWTDLAEPWAAFIKEACPTAYSFPFDDATSTFTCNTPDVSDSQPNTMDYTITFCPDGLDGLGS